MEIKLNEGIAEKLKKRVESTDEFKSMEEYVNYILKQVVERLGRGTDTNMISIPNDLANKIREKITESGFNSLSSYVVYVLRQTLSGIKIDQEEEEKVISEEDKKLIEARLKDLGDVGLKLK